MGEKLILELGNDVEILSLSRKHNNFSRKNIKNLYYEDNNLEKKINDFKPDVFLNIASESKSIVKNLEDYQSISNFNIATQTYLIDVAISSGVQFIINIRYPNYSFCNVGICINCKV